MVEGGGWVQCEMIWCQSAIDDWDLEVDVNAIGLEDSRPDKYVSSLSNTNV